MQISNHILIHLRTCYSIGRLKTRHIYLSMKLFQIFKLLVLVPLSRLIQFTWIFLKDFQIEWSQALIIRKLSISSNIYPHVYAKDRRLDPAKLKIAKAKFQYILDIGIICPSKSSRSSTLYMVPKKSSDDWKLCADDRDLNSSTILYIQSHVFSIFHLLYSMLQCFRVLIEYRLITTWGRRYL